MRLQAGSPFLKRASRTLLLSISIFTALLLLLQVAQAQDAGHPRAPPGLVIDETGYGLSPNGNPSYSYVINVTFQLSPDDPDPINGSLNYTLLTQLGTVGNATLQSWCARLCNANGTNGGLAPVPNHPGWVYFTGPEGIVYPLVNGTVWNWTVNVQNDTSSINGGASCSVQQDAASIQNDPISNNGWGASTSELNLPLNIITLDNSVACGTGFEPPVAGLVAASGQQYNSSGPTAGSSLSSVSYLLSPGDPNRTVGAFDYYLFASYINETSANSTSPNVCAFGRIPQSPVFLSNQCAILVGYQDPIGPDDIAGLRTQNVTGFGYAGQVNALWFMVLARDNLTHQRSNLSCFVQIEEGQIESVDSCGGLNSNILPAHTISGTAPVFPGLNPVTWSAQVGVDTGTGAMLLGTILLLFTALIGFGFARGAGAGIGAMCGVLLCGAFNLYQTWMLTIIFMAVIAAIWYLAKGRQAPE